MILPVFAVLYYVQLWYYQYSEYFSGATKIYQAYSLICFYIYMIHFRFPDQKERIGFMVALERQTRRKQQRVHDKGSYRWYRVRSMLIYQNTLVAIFNYILQIIVMNTVCAKSTTQLGIQGFVEFFGFISTFVTITNILQVYRRLRPEYEGSKMVRKFFSFKLFILVIIHQQLLFGILEVAKAVPPTYYMSAADFQDGIPAFMVVCEAFLFTPLYWYAFNAFPFRRALKHPELESVQHPKDRLSVWNYLLAIVYPTDVIQETWDGMKTFASLFRGAGAYDYTGGTGIDFLQRQANEGKLNQQTSMSSDDRSDTHSPLGESPPYPPPATQGYDVLGQHY